MSAGPAPGTDEGEKLGKYRLLKRLGVGGMAEVYLAETLGTAGFQKRLVVKRVLPELQTNPSFIEMFLDEARLAARLTHPNIAQTFDLGEADGSYYIAMEHVPGITLRALFTRLEERGLAFPVDAALRVMAQLLEALEYAHALADDGGTPLKIVHRDVTPANVMVTPQGGLKLLDFGIARAVTRQHRTQVGFTKGKVGFMSPEHLKGEPLDCRADVFSAGTVFYILLTGSAPFALKADSREDLRDMVEGRFIAPRLRKPNLAPRLEEILVKAMAKRREDRYLTAGAMLRDVEDYAAAERLLIGGRPLQELVTSVFPEFRQSAPGEASPVPPRLPPRGTPPTVDSEPAQALTATLDHRPPPPEARVTTSSGETLLDDEEPAGLEVTTPYSTLHAVDGPHRKSPKKKSSSAPSILADPRGRWVAVVVAVVALGAAGLVTARVLRDRSAPVAAVALPPTARPEPKPPAPVAQAEPVNAVKAEPLTVPTPPVVDEPPKEPTSPQAEASVAPPKTPVDKPRVKKAPPPPVVIAAAETPVDPKSMGSVRVTSIPTAVVRVLGKTFGKTPVRFDLPAGMHRLELEYPGAGGKRALLVNVVAGKETPVSEVLAR
jgi:serine/threonine-protein kinase